MRGWPVALNYRGNAAAADATLAAIRKAGGTAHAFAADVADPAQVARLFDQAEAALGGLDAVVVNAGIVEQVMPLAEMTTLGNRLAVICLDSSTSRVYVAIPQAA